MTQKKMTTLEKIEDIDKRVLYWITTILICYALISPLGLPILISSYTTDFYDVFNELKPGDVVLFSLDAELATIPELGPSIDVLVNELCKKDVYILFVGYFNWQPAVFKMLVDPIMNKYSDKKYGVNYVDLGFLPGTETGLKRLAGDIQGTCVTDSYGTTLSELPMMNDITDATDIDLIIVTESGSVTQNYMRHWVLPHGNIIISSVTMTLVNGLIPYIDAGTLKGILGGIRGAAELELITRRPGAAIRSMDAISLAHIYLIILVIIGNVIFFYKRGTLQKVI